jgi:hypothetical protein
VTALVRRERPVLVPIRTPGPALQARRSGAEDGDRRVDHQRLAAALARLRVRGPRRFAPFEHGHLVGEAGFAHRRRGGQELALQLAAYTCTEAVGLPRAEPGANYSPDSSMRLVRSGGNIGLRRGADTTTTLLTTDAETDNDYGSMAGNSTAYVSVLRAGTPLAPSALWSPDSKRFVSYRLDQRGVGLLHLVQSVPQDSSFRTRAWAYHYALPGDTIVSRASLLVFDPVRRTVVSVQLPPSNVIYQDPVSWNEVTWSSDGSKLYVLQMARGAQSYAVFEVNPETGAARRLAEERSRTLAEPSLTLGQRDFYPLANGQVIWFSERDGWAHLYLLNGGDGAVVRQLTSGPWIVIRLVRVDEAARRIYFVAAAREPGRDPYLRHFYSVGLDGTGLTLLTPDDADHEVSVAPSGRWFLDRASRWDKSPVTSLRSLDGKSSFEVERADISALVAAGWRAPERLKLVAADGSTDIYGLLYRPARFDSTRRYPILEEVYPGPQANAASPIFQAGGNVRALTELGHGAWWWMAGARHTGPRPSTTIPTAGSRRGRTRGSHRRVGPAGAALLLVRYLPRRSLRALGRRIHVDPRDAHVSRRVQGGGIFGGQSRPAWLPRHLG